MGGIKWKSAFEHAQNVLIHILHMPKVSHRQWRPCQTVQKLPPYDWRHIFAECGPSIVGIKKGKNMPIWTFPHIDPH